jgi:hypothetical protein
VCTRPAKASVNRCITARHLLARDGEARLDDGDAVGEVSRWSGIFAFLDSSAVAPTGDD